jgi:molybdopterin synthase catalytic subunit
VGATVLFVGTVRDHARGKEVRRLEYEAYVPMCERQLERIAERCGTAHGGAEVAIDHRYGPLDIGDISVVIAAAAPHRAEAFAACRQAIEEIKTDVPIFKRELTTDGDEWVGWGGG